MVPFCVYGMSQFVEPSLGQGGSFGVGPDDRSGSP